jgi:AraC-like DNA-binding protein
MTGRCPRQPDFYARLVREYLQSHCAEDVTVHAVGRAFGLSESSLRRRLKQEAGLRFHAVLDQVRVEKLLTALSAEPDLKVEALAVGVGWRSRTTLYAAVRRVTGRHLDELRAYAATGAGSLQLAESGGNQRLFNDL